MTVVHVINRWGPGGAEKQLGELLHRLSRPQGVIEFQAGDAADRRRDLRRLRLRLARADPDVVVAWLDRSQIAVALTAPRRARLVASLRGLPRRHGVASSWAMRLALTRYHRLVTNSQAACDATLSFARPLRLPACDVIPNGVELPPAPRAPSPAPRLRVGYIGRDSRDKGLDVCLDALELLGDEVAACLVGHGVPEAVAARPGRRGWTTFGRISDPWRHCAALDVLLVPSRSEGSPNVTLEAFARGVPVIGTPAGGAAELLAGGRGLVVPIGDASALAAAVRALGTDRRAAAERARRARAYVEHHHAWAQVVARWERLLDDAITGRRSARDAAQAPASA